MNALPYTALDVLAMVMDGTHLPAHPATQTAPEAAAPDAPPAPAQPEASEFRQAA